MESDTNNSRNDVVASNEDFAFVFMFKLDKNAKVALAQFRERDYYWRYLNSSKKIFFVGVNFDPRNWADCLID